MQLKGLFFGLIESLILSGVKSAHDFFPIGDDDVVVFKKLNDHRIGKQPGFPNPLLPRAGNGFQVFSLHRWVENDFGECIGQRFK